jgi:hypothetical protein
MTHRCRPWLAGWAGLYQAGGQGQPVVRSGHQGQGGAGTGPGRVSLAAGWRAARPDAGAAGLYGGGGGG